MSAFSGLTLGAIERVVLIAAGLLFLSVVASKTAGRFGIPSLLVFLGLGMLAGAHGPGGIAFHDIAFAQTVAVIALSFILFSGGMSTDLKSVRPVIKGGLVLSTVGVLIATALVGLFAHQFLGFSVIGGLLLGATVSSTDVAAVFTVLRSREISLKDGLKPLLEFESAVNDPITVIVSVGLLQLDVAGDGSIGLLPLVNLALLFLRQVALGLAVGWCGARAALFLINRIHLDFEGLYPVLSIAIVLALYGLTQVLGGSGFLAVYVAGLLIGDRVFLHKKSLMQFHDGITWLMQITMFLAMGLLVTPGDLPAIAASGLALSLFLALIARPVSVFLCLAPFGFSAPSSAIVAWSGLRGAVPIILATYPLLAGIPEAHLIFNLVFFVVFTSVLVQGASIARVARLLGVNAPLTTKFRFPIEYNPTTSLKNELTEIYVPESSGVVGHSLLELQLPAHALVVLIRRGDDVVVPRGGTRVEARDTLLVLAEKPQLAEIKRIVMEAEA